MALLDVIIDRLADILERAGSEIEGISREIFDTTRGNQPSRRTISGRYCAPWAASTI